MNMKTALRNLYKAITGTQNTKTNYSKLLVDIHHAITGKDPTNKNNHARIINELAENWPEGGSGGGGDGGGSSDFSTAEVTIVLGENIPTFPTSLPVCTDFVDLEYPEDNYSGIEINNGAESGKYIIPLYKGSCYLYFDSLTRDISATGNVTISSGSVTTIVIIYGDCTITIS